MKKLNTSVELFSNLIEKYSYIEKDASPLTNFTFFLGAGFGKAWNISFPTGKQLFSFKMTDMRHYAEGLQDFLLAEERESDFIDFSTFKDIIYEINMQEKYSTLRSRYLDEFNIGALKDELKFLVQIKYEKHIKLNYFDSKAGKFIIPANLGSEQKDILNFFRFLEDQQTGHKGIPEGIRLNAYSDQVVHLFRRKPSIHSDSNRPPS